MPRKFGERWEIIRPLVEGGQAHTYIVHDSSQAYDSDAVLKSLKNPKRAPRFKQEVRAIRDLNHRNVLRLIDAKVDGDDVYFVSEYCELGSLEAKTNDIQSLSFDERLGLFAQVCAGVGAAHVAGITHRDIKPGNIFRRATGEAVIGDFGLCFVEGDDRHTASAEAVGARYYMAPELAEGRFENVTPRSDVYSLGKVLYWLMAGRAFDRESHRRKDLLLTRRFKNEHRLLHVHALLDKLIVFEPAMRLADAVAVAEHGATLRRLLDGRYPTLEHAPQSCSYCGLGIYRSGPGLFKYGIQPTNGEPRLYACDNCGHTLLFKPELSRNREWLDLATTSPDDPEGDDTGSVSEGDFVMPVMTREQQRERLAELEQLRGYLRDGAWMTLSTRAVSHNTDWYLIGLPIPGFDTRPVESFHNATVEGDFPPRFEAALATFVRRAEAYEASLKQQEGLRRSLEGVEVIKNNLPAVFQEARRTNVPLSRDSIGALAPALSGEQADSLHNLYELRRATQGHVLSELLRAHGALVKETDAATATLRRASS